MGVKLNKSPPNSMLAVFYAITSKATVRVRKGVGSGGDQCGCDTSTVSTSQDVGDIRDLENTTILRSQSNLNIGNVSVGNLDFYNSEVTLSFSERAKGWISFKSFVPESGVSINNEYYTFKGGDMYRHNTNPIRNNYYGVQYDSSITSVFNEQPIQTKVFKTIELESDSSWDATFQTDLQEGSIASGYFSLKEGSYFSFIRYNQNQENLNLRSTQGVGTCANVTGSIAVPPLAIEFSFSVDSILNIGATAYKIDAGSLVELGPVTSISEDRRIVTVLNPVNNAAGGDSIVYLKDPVAESFGMLGYYLEFTLTNSNTTATELFSVNSQVFKSYP